MHYESTNWLPVGRSGTGNPQLHWVYTILEHKNTESQNLEPKIIFILCVFVSLCSSNYNPNRFLLDLKNSPFCSSQLAGFRWRKRRFTRWNPMVYQSASTLSWQVINALITLHQCFDDSSSTERFVNNSNKPLFTSQRAFLRSVKSLFPNHILGSSLNAIIVVFFLKYAKTPWHSFAKEFFL